MATVYRTQVLSLSPDPSQTDQTMESDTEDDATQADGTSLEPKIRRMSSKSRERAGVKTLDLRRPVRPVDRQKMRPWLKNHLESGSVFGLKWLQKEKGIFQVSWRHASRLGWNLETDGDVFEKWARHTGIFKDGDTPEPKRWKANFRCALHSLPDVKELTDPLERRGHNANRTYRFLHPSEVDPSKRKGNLYTVTVPKSHEPSTPPPPPPPLVTQPEVFEDSSSQTVDSDERNTDDDDGQYREIYVLPQSDHDYAARMERQYGNDSVTTVLSEHGSGYVVIKTKKAANLPTTISEALNITPRPEYSGSMTNLTAKTIDDKKIMSRRRGKSSVPKEVSFTKAMKASEKQHFLNVNVKALLSRMKPGSKKLVKKGSDTTFGRKPCPKTQPVSTEDSPASRTSSPSQALGFEALLEAANIARMDTLTSDTTDTMTATCRPIQSSRQDSGVSEAMSPAPVVSSVGGLLCTAASEMATFSTADSSCSSTPSSSMDLSTMHSYLLSLLSSHGSLDGLQSFLDQASLQSDTLSSADSSSDAAFGMEGTASVVKVEQDSQSTSTNSQNACAVAETGGNAGTDYTVMDNVSSGNSVLKHLLEAAGQAMVSSASPTIPVTPLTLSVDPQTLCAMSPMATASSQPSYSVASSSTSQNVDHIVKIENTSDQLMYGNFNQMESMFQQDSITLQDNKASLVHVLGHNQSGGVVSTLPQTMASTAQNLDLVKSSSVDPLGTYTPQVNTNTCTLQSSAQSMPTSLQNTNAQISVSFPQTVNVLVLNPSVMLAVPQGSESTTQPVCASTATLPPMDLQEFLNMCGTAGSHQIVQKEGGNEKGMDNVVMCFQPEGVGQAVRSDDVGFEIPTQSAASLAPGDTNLQTATMSVTQDSLLFAGTQDLVQLDTSTPSISDS